MVFLMMTLSESLMYCHTKSIRKQEQVKKAHNNAYLLDRSDRGDKDLFFYDFVSALNRQIINRGERSWYLSLS